MLFDTSPGRSISNLPQLAMALGLTRTADRAEIARRFETRTRFDLSLAIEEHPVLSDCQQTWSVRVLPGAPRPRLEIREGCRGDWTDRHEDLPLGLADILEARPARDGGIETLRGLPSWERMEWCGGQGRRLKSRRGEFLAQVVIPGARRKTGEVRLVLRLEPIGSDDPQPQDARRIALPCRAGDINHLATQMRADCTMLQFA